MWGTPGMKQLGIILKSEAVKLVAINLTVAIALPIAVSLLAPFVRPVARDVIKTGIRGYEKARRSAAEFGEFVDDLVAEVQDELQGAKHDAANLAEPNSKSRKRTG